MIEMLSFCVQVYEEPTPVLRSGDLVVRYGIDEAGYACVEQAKVMYIGRQG